MTYSDTDTGTRPARDEQPAGATRRIVVLTGSLRRDSYNHLLALAIAKLLPADFVAQHIRIDDLPLYNQDDDQDMLPQAQRLKREIQAADGLLFVTPEYNRSIPGVLKNAIDIASRPYGTNSFAGKPAGIVGISIGAVGTAVAQQHLRGVLAYLDAPTLAQPEVFLRYTEGMLDAWGDIHNDSTRSFLQSWVDAYVAWVNAVPARRR
ncbi:MAG TPA: NAD(P)H-dependent oxidoreductase [Burkholderiaceae bacterium]|nr:NAD(P)H-dependent oxidoreductase [Burkholderiaceae bacterium]